MKFFTLFLLAVALTASVICLQHQPAAAIPTADLPVPTAPHGRLHRLRGPRAARVWELYGQPGTRVTRGQILAKLAVPLGSQERQQRQAALHQAQQDYAVARRGPDAAATVQAQLRVKAAQERLAAVPQALTFEYVVAPAAGTILALPLTAGEYAADTATLVVLAEPQPAELASVR